MYFCKAPSQRQPPLLIARLANLKAEILLGKEKKKEQDTLEGLCYF